MNPASFLLTTTILLSAMSPILGQTKVEVTLAGGEKREITVTGTGRDTTFSEFYGPDGTAYKGASISAISDESLGLMHESGAVRIPWEEVPESIGKIIGVDISAKIAGKEKVKEDGVKAAQKKKEEFAAFASKPPETDEEGVPLYVKWKLKKLALSISTLDPDTITVYEAGKLLFSENYTWQSLIDWGAKTTKGEGIRGRAIFVLERDGTVTTIPLPRE